MNNVIFDGHDFSSEFRVGNIEQMIANPRPNLIEKGGNGIAFNGATLGELTFTVALYLLGGSAIGMTAEEARRAKLRTLASWLDVNTPRKLEIGDDSGLYYMAVPSGEAPMSRYVNAASVEVTFVAVDPIAYGEERTVNVPSGGSVTFEVGGTYPTGPTITAAGAIRNSSSLVWGLRIDDGDFIHVATGSSTSKPVEIDCGARTLAVDGAASVPTLDSDWLALAPGQHVLRMDQGTGAATVRFRERWL